MSLTLRKMLYLENMKNYFFTLSSDTYYMDGSLFNQNCFYKNLFFKID